MPRSKSQHELSESQKRMYALEKGENFRWIARLLASHAPSGQLILTPAHRVPASTQLAISDLGQFAEMAHGSVDPGFVWRKLELLMRPDYPLERYDALKGSKLMCAFHGQVAKLQGCIVYRPETKQLILAFSGTSSPLQTLHDLDSRLVNAGALSAEIEGYSEPPPAVHAGFWRLYQGVKGVALEGLERSLKTLEVDELIVTGHSMGGALSSYLILDLLHTQPAFLVEDLRLRLLTYGSPRVGNSGLKEIYKHLVSQFRRKRGEDTFQEHAVKGYNDGVHCLPPVSLGYRHLSSTPIYLYHGYLYQIPEGFDEYTEFTVEAEDGAPPPDYPLGGHNYYNNRDMEKCLLRLQGLDTLGETDWERRYLDKLAEENKKR